MKIKALLPLIIILISCQKQSQPTHTIYGAWIGKEAIYTFDSELHITQDGITENYCYYVSNDTIYLDYGFPFFIEKLTRSELILSKNDGKLKYCYEFSR